MNALEIAQLLRFVHALCPAQRMDELTPDAWLLVLADVDFDDAKVALKPLGQQLRFIAPADIAGEVRRARATRPSFPPGTGREALNAEHRAIVDGPEGVAGYLRTLRAQRRRIAGPPVALGAAIAIEPTFVDVPSKRPRTTAVPGPRRQQLAIEAAPAPQPGDTELAIAEAVLGELPDWWQWMDAARRDLEADGQPATRRAVTVRAAELATANQAVP